MNDRKNSNKGLMIALAALMIVLLVTVLVFVSTDKENASPAGQAETTVTAAPTQVPSPEPLTYTEITFLSAGDIMYHRPQIRAAKTGDGGYDFTNNMQYVKPIIEQADFATANLETTFSGPEIGYEAKQFPYFNAPDAVADSLVFAGFDLLFTANNHCYDHGGSGLKRTLGVLEDRGLDYVGTRKDESYPSYKTVDVQGIRIGLINYTLEMGSEGDIVRINGNTVASEDKTLIDTFSEEAPDKLYAEIEARMRELREGGADCVIVCLHWGVEYALEPNSSQRAIAQKLCDMGVDVLLASHPHLIEPVEVITSSDGTRQMPCYFSMGNYISNQSRDSLASDTVNAIYTENGMMPILTIRKYSNGETYVRKIEYISTWVHIHGSYEIVPIAAALEDPNAYGLTDETAISRARHAKELTDSLAAAGVNAYNELWQEPYPEAEAA